MSLSSSSSSSSSTAAGTSVTFSSATASASSDASSLTMDELIGELDVVTNILTTLCGKLGKTCISENMSREAVRMRQLSLALAEPLYLTSHHCKNAQSQAMDFVSLDAMGIFDLADKMDSRAAAKFITLQQEKLHH